MLRLRTLIQYTTLSLSCFSESKGSNDFLNRCGSEIVGACSAFQVKVRVYWYGIVGRESPIYFAIRDRPQLKDLFDGLGHWIKYIPPPDESLKYIYRRNPGPLGNWEWAPWQEPVGPHQLLWKLDKRKRTGLL